MYHSLNNLLLAAFKINVLGLMEKHKKPGDEEKVKFDIHFPVHFLKG